MTTSDYITQKFQAFGIQLSEADLLDICISSKISGEGEMNEDCHDRVSVAIARFIPSLLLRPSSMSEGGVSISRAQRDDILAFYSFLCKKHGLRDELSNKSKCTFR